MLSSIYAIAHNTALESVRQTVFAVLLLGGIFLLAINPGFAAFSFWDDNKLLADLGLSTIFMCGMLLSAFTAAGVFHREIENKTVLSVVSKPIARPAFVVGKFLGVLFAVGLASYIWTLAFLLSVRHGVMITTADPFDWPVILLGIGALLLSVGLSAAANYWYGWVFNSTLAWILPCLLTLAYVGVLGIDKDWKGQALSKDWNPQMMWALLLVGEMLALMVALAVGVSARLGQMMTLGACSIFFVVGLSSDYLFGRFQESSFIARMLYHLVPNLQVLWISDALNQDHAVSTAYIGTVSMYAVLYILAFLSLGVALFQTREVG